MGTGALLIGETKISSIITSIFASELCDDKNFTFCTGDDCSLHLAWLPRKRVIKLEAYASSTWENWKGRLKKTSDLS